jgi:hypothetical protein
MPSHIVLSVPGGGWFVQRHNVDQLRSSTGTANLAGAMSQFRRVKITPKGGIEMKFFVPGANDSHHAQDLYHTMRDRISRQCGTVTDKRIYHLKFHHEGALCNIAVGDSLRYLDEQWC